jgi:hypothetical protein
MGSLANVGFLDAQSGNISDSAKIQYINNVVENMKNSDNFQVLGQSFPIQYYGSDSVSNTFVLENLESHRARYLAWHQIHFDVALQGVASMLDQIPAAGVAAKVIPYFDPFQPIIDVLNLLKNKLASALGDLDIVEFLTSNLTSLLFDIGDFIVDIVSISTDFIAGVASAVDRAINYVLSFISNSILPKLGKSSQEIASITQSIRNLLKDNNFKASFLASITSLVTSIVSAPASLTLPAFTFDFLSFDVDIPNPSAILGAGPPPGIGYFFTQLITGFFEGVLNLLSTAGEWILKITQGVGELLSYLLQQLLSFLGQIITSIYPAIDSAVSFIASIAEFCKKLIQMTIVTILGYLLGPGIITLAAARTIELI